MSSNQSVYEYGVHAVYAGYKTIVNKGLVIGSWGNVSMRKENVYITPSGIPLAQMTGDSIIQVSMEGEVIEGDGKPSVDTPIHLALYSQWDWVGGVVHTHSPYCTTFAQAKQPIPCIGTTHADHFYGDVPVVYDMTEAEIATDFEKNCGLNIVNYFLEVGLDPKTIPAALLPNHGPVVWGRTTDEAIENAVVLEEIAKLAYRSLVLANGSGLERLDKHLLDKHYLRKHGDDKYYGQ